MVSQEHDCAPARQHKVELTEAERLARGAEPNPNPDPNPRYNALISGVLFNATEHRRGDNQREGVDATGPAAVATETVAVGWAAAAAARAKAAVGWATGLTAAAKTAAAKAKAAAAKAAAAKAAAKAKTAALPTARAAAATPRPAVARGSAVAVKGMHHAAASAVTLSAALPPGCPKIEVPGTHGSKLRCVPGWDRARAGPG